MERTIVVALIEGGQIVDRVELPVTDADHAVAVRLIHETQTMHFRSTHEIMAIPEQVSTLRLGDRLPGDEDDGPAPSGMHCV